MELPKFLLADHSERANDLFIVHTQYPNFILNVATDEVHWMEEFSKEDEVALKESATELIEAAFTFYDAEMKALNT